MSDPQQVVDGAVSGNGQPQPVNAGTLSSGGAATASADGSDVCNAFLLGWSMAELKGRLQVAAISRAAAIPDALREGDKAGAAPASPRSADPLQLQFQTSNAFWLASVWRVIFGRISTLQHTFFPESATTDTRYDPGEKKPSYLYPDSDNYADIGIRDSAASPILKAFLLREATRRAINCLTLLYLQPELSLLPDIVTRQQAHLVKAILTPAQLVADTAVAPAEEANAGAARTPGDLVGAIRTLSDQTVLFLEAWDSYLHESFYAAGVAANDEIKLIAYEGGRALSMLSWDLSNKAVALEDDSAAQSAERAARLSAIWRDAFDESAISRTQHQISVLGTALDDAYYARTGLPRPQAGADQGALDPALPHQAIQAVKRSLDYWQRAVEWFGESAPAKGEGAIKLWHNLRLALIEQANIWQTLIIGHETLGSFTAENVTKQILQEVMVSFETVAQQQGLMETAEAVGREFNRVVEVASEQIQDTLTRIHDVAHKELSQLFRNFWPILAGIGVIVLLGIVAVVVRLVQQHPFELPDVTSLLASVAGAVGGFGLFRARQRNSESQTALDGEHGTAKTRVNDSIGQIQSVANADPSGAATGLPAAKTTPGTGLVARLENTFGTVSKAILDAFEKGYEQIRVDLAGLGYSVAVAHPLVEFFVLNISFENIRADYDFMMEIIWNHTDRKEEVMRVAYAAFGPLGMFAFAHLQSAKDSNKPQTQAIDNAPRAAS
jgi:hypothetical protein